MFTLGVFLFILICFVLFSVFTRVIHLAEHDLSLQLSFLVSLWEAMGNIFLGTPVS